MRFFFRKSLSVSILFIAACTNVSAWNALGHRLAAQIAYDHLTDEAKTKFNQLNHELDVVYSPRSFTNAAVWLDAIKYDNHIPWFHTMHYVDKFFSDDGTPLPDEAPINAVWAINKAKGMLSDNVPSGFDKGIAFRILIHVIADLHQPLHAGSRVSYEYPKGDAGGNLFRLGRNNVGKNLHSYWDQGGGAFKTQQPVNDGDLKKRAQGLERKWPCHLHEVSLDPEQWLNESFQIAKDEAYNLTPGQKPDIQYQNNAKYRSEQRIAMAGCRLAATLNQLS